MHKKDTTRRTEQDLLGNFVREVVHGLEGLAIAHTEHWYGCSHILIDPTERLTDGGVHDMHSFDEQRVEFVRKGPKPRHKIEWPTTPLGARARHKFNGFEGIVVSRTARMNHGPRVAIEPTQRKANGELNDVAFFEEDMIDVIDSVPIESTIAEPQNKPGSCAIDPSLGCRDF